MMFEKAKFEKNESNFASLNNLLKEKKIQC